MFDGSAFEQHRRWSPSTFFTGVSYLNALRRSVKMYQGDHDALLVHWPWPLLLGVPKGSSRLPQIGICHGSELRWLERSFLARCWFKRAAKQLMLLATTRRDSIELLKPLYAGEMIAAPMGCDPKVFKKPSATIRFAVDPNSLLGVGRLHRAKGFDLLIRAAAHLNRPVVLLGDGPEREHLLRLAQELKVSLDLRGFRPIEEVADAMRSARVLVVPSRPTEAGGGEGFPTVLSQGIVSGIPIVASRTSGIPDWVPEECLFDPLKESDLLRALHAQIQRPRENVIASEAPFVRRTLARQILGVLRRDSPSSTAD
jgi:glycosyltransferase involved in cell wall biosynthesis